MVGSLAVVSVLAPHDAKNLGLLPSNLLSLYCLAKFDSLNPCHTYMINYMSCMVSCGFSFYSPYKLFSVIFLSSTLMTSMMALTQSLILLKEEFRRSSLFLGLSHHPAGSSQLLE